MIQAQFSRGTGTRRPCGVARPTCQHDAPNDATCPARRAPCAQPGPRHACTAPKLPAAAARRCPRRRGPDAAWRSQRGHRERITRAGEHATAVHTPRIAESLAVDFVDPCGKVLAAHEDVLASVKVHDPRGRPLASGAALGRHLAGHAIRPRCNDLVERRSTLGGHSKPLRCRNRDPKPPTGLGTYRARARCRFSETGPELR